MGISHIYSSPIADGINTQLVRPSDWNSAHTYELQDAVSLLTAGNTAGVVTAISTGTLYLAGGSNITLSQSANSVSVIGPSTAGLISKVNISAGTTSNNLSALTFADGNGVSFGLDESVLTGMVETNYQPPGAYLTTAALSQDSSKYAGTNGAITGGSITVNTSGVSVNLPAYLTTARASNDAVGLNTALTGNGVAWTVNSSGISLNVPAFLTTAMASNRASDFVNATAAFAGTSASGTIGSAGISVSIGPYLTTAGLSQDSSKYAGTNGAITGGSITVNTSGVSVNLPAYLTTAMASNRGSDFVQATATIAGTSISGTIASNVISLSVGPYLTTAMQSASSSVFAKTGFTTTTAGGAVIAGTHDTVGLLLAVPAFLTTAMQSASSSVFAKTGFTTTTAAGAVIAGTHNTDGLLLAVPGYLTTAMASDRGSDFVQANATIAGTNVSGTIASNGISLSVDAAGGGLTNIRVSAGTTSNLLSALTFSNTNGVSFGINASTITASVAQPPLAFLEPWPLTNTVGLTMSDGNGILWPIASFVNPGWISGGRLNVLAINTATGGIARPVTAAAFNSNTTGTKNQSATWSLMAALWSQGTGANSTRLESFWSNSFSFGLTNIVNVSISGTGSSVTVTEAWSFSYIQDIGSDGAYTFSQFATNANANSGTSMNTSALSSVAGSIRSALSNSVVFPIGFNTTLAPGGYWLGIASAATSASAVTNFGGTGGASALTFSHLSMIGISRLELNTLFRNFGSTSTIAKSQLIPGGGYYSAFSASPPQFIAISSDIVSWASQAQVYFNFLNRGLTK